MPPASATVADNPEPGALHDLAGQPSGNEADHQYDQETFTRHVHLPILQLHQQADEFSPAHEHHQRQARPKVNICFFKEEADHPLLLVKPHAQREDYAKLLTLKRPVDYAAQQRYPRVTKYGNLILDLRLVVQNDIQYGGWRSLGRTGVRKDSAQRKC
jgi:hypothetical protein